MFTFPTTMFAAATEQGDFSTLSWHLDGTNDFLQSFSASVIDSANTLSVFGWVYHSGSVAGQVTVGRWRDGGPNKVWRIQINPDNHFFARVSDGSNERTKRSNIATIATGQWYHLGFTFNSGVLKIYVNGVENTDNAEEGSAVATLKTGSTAALEMGSIILGSSAFLNGYLDDTTIWSNVLGTSEILEIFNSGKPANLSSNFGNYTSSASLLSYWRMGDNALDSNTTIRYQINSLNLLSYNRIDPYGIQGNVP